MYTHIHTVTNSHTESHTYIIHIIHPHTSHISQYKYNTHVHMHIHVVTHVATHTCRCPCFRAHTCCDSVSSSPSHEDPSPALISPRPPQRHFLTVRSCHRQNRGSWRVSFRSFPVAWQGRVGMRAQVHHVQEGLGAGLT